MKVLVVDSNIVFARMVADFLATNLKSVAVDLAQNVPVLRRRLREAHYDFIIADVMNAFDTESMVEELQRYNVPMLVWASIPSAQLPLMVCALNGKICTKPDRIEDVGSLLRPVMTTACDA